MLRNKVKKLLEPGDIFGELAFLQRSTPATFIADHDNVLLYRIEEKLINTLLSVDPNFSERFFQMLNNKLSFQLYNLPLKQAIAQLNNHTLEEEVVVEERGMIGEEESKDFMLAELFDLSTDDLFIRGIQNLP